jgi:hypothetical protein
MEGTNRFTPRQINKALRLLRELPVKDGRRSIQETLRLLEQGMKDALEKGYSRGEIQQKIAEAEVTISATTLKGFLAEEQKDAGRKRDKETVEKPEKPGPRHEGKTAEKTERASQRHEEETAGASENSSRNQGEELAGNISPGSIIIKPDTPKEDL